MWSELISENGKGAAADGACQGLDSLAHTVCKQVAVRVAELPGSPQGLLPEEALLASLHGNDRGSGRAQARTSLRCHGPDFEDALICEDVRVPSP